MALSRFIGATTSPWYGFISYKTLVKFLVAIILHVCINVRIICHLPYRRLQKCHPNLTPSATSSGHHECKSQPVYSFFTQSMVSSGRYHFQCLYLYHVTSCSSSTSLRERHCTFITLYVKHNPCEKTALSTCLSLK